VPAAAAATTGPTVEFLGASGATELNGVATYTVKVTGVPDDADLDLVVFTAVDRAGLAAAERGTLPARQIGFLPRAPLAGYLQPDGSALLQFTVVGQAPQFDDEIRVPDPGVYPVRIRALAHGGSAELARTIAFLERPQPGSALPVAVVLPASGRPSTAPDGSVSPAAADVARLSSIVQFMTDRPSFPLTIAPRPELLAALKRTNPGLLDQLTLNAVHHDTQVLARTFVRVDVPALDAADIGGEVGSQLALGERTITETLPGTRPDRRVWYADGPLDPAALAALGRLGVLTVLVDPDQLQPSAGGPAEQPVDLATADPSLPMQAIIGDVSLDAFTLRAGDTAAAAAHRLVAELAVRALEPQIGHGVVLVPRDTFQVDGPYLRAVVDALARSKLVQPTTLDGYLRRTVPARGQPRHIVAAAAADLKAYAQGLFVTRVAIDHLSSTLPSSTHLFDGLTGMMTMAGSADFGVEIRQAYLDAANARLLPVRRAITAVAREQVTLAGRNGTLPIIVSNAFGEPVSVRLRIDSSKLTVTGNNRVVMVPANGSVTVEIPVQARTSAWRFPVQVLLSTPVGNDSMAAPVTFDLRVVGLSGLGIGVSAAAGLVLLTWWVTHARSRRRRRRQAANDGSSASPSEDAGAADGTGPAEPIVV
jgi:hypothetical protein